VWSHPNGGNQVCSCHVSCPFDARGFLRQLAEGNGFNDFAAHSASARALKWPVSVTITRCWRTAKSWAASSGCPSRRKTVPGGGRAATTAKSDALRMDTSRRAKPRWLCSRKAGDARARRGRRPGIFFSSSVTGSRFLHAVQWMRRSGRPASLSHARPCSAPRTRRR
jgi:hypothetical protein